MANNTIMVNMKFQADTTQAKQAMQSLQNQLTQVMKVTNADLPGVQLSNSLNQASIAAAQLKVHLQSAFNQDTGKLDLSKFDQSLKRSGMTLEKYKIALSAAGPAGQQAFNQLAISVAQAEIPIIRISERMRKLGQTLANTFRWQISSSLLMGVTSTLSSAYGYAQDLNESLNNIRIVTGYSADQMEKFAKQANRAAKALSTTTTEYTNASLIYYQQGLSEAEIEKRTELTIKMANVTGQSAQNVSDQLTAVWNNFYDGTQSLEHYVDVMTALGAATASSSDEISEGLNKFAAVAETVGLSYEYAASALATVTATTRESADVVGNAFKTLFARIQGLKLGETLDDGTTLNKYSTALETVGISIFTQNGQLKDMNTILDEMGSKWNTLSKDQQVALAQTVAGVRQYNQLIALMDNWDEFQVNLNIANTSEGALQEQADIYAESWEAARDRVTASLEAIYGSLLDDDAFISILNFFADLLENINDVIDSVGGLKGVLMLLGTAFLTLGKNAIASGMSSIGHTFMGFTAKGREKLNKLREEGLNQAVSQYDNSTPTGAMQQSVVKDRIRLEQDYQAAVAGASAEHQEMARIIKDSVAAEAELVEKEIERARLAEETTDKAKKGFVHTYLRNATPEQKTAYNNYITGMTQQGAASSLLDRVLVTREQAFQDPLNKVFQTGATDDESLAKASTAAQEIRTRLDEIGIGSEQAEQALKDMYGPDVVEALKNYRNEIIKTQEEIKKLQSLDEKDRKVNTPKLTDEEQKELQELKNKKKKKRGKVSPEDLEKENKRIAELTAKENNAVVNSSQAAEDSVNKLNNEIREQQKVITEATKGQRGAATALQETGNKAEQCGAQMDKSAGATGHFNNKVKETPNAINQAMTSTITFSQRLVGFASAAMSAAMAIQAIQSLGAIWSEEDANFGDQILQTMMSLGMVIPMVTSALNRKNIAQALGITLTMKDGAITGVDSANKLFNAIATKIQEKAQKSLNFTLSTTIALYATMAIALVAIIAVIAAVASAIKALTNDTNANAEAVKEANEKVKELTESYENLKAAADDFKNSVSDYNEALKALAELGKETEDYNKKLEEVNEKARQLIETYGLWNDYKIVDGLIKIDETALEAAQAEQNRIVAQAQSAMYQSKIEANKANLNLRAEQVADTQSIKLYAEYAMSPGQYYGAGFIDEEDLKELAEFASNLKEEAGGVELSAEQLSHAINEAIAPYPDIIYETYKFSQESTNTLWDFVDSLEQAEAANRYYAKEILKIAVEDEYGELAKKWATDEEGNFDIGKYNQILEGLRTLAANNKVDGKTLQESLEGIDSSQYQHVNALRENILFNSTYKDTIAKILGTEYINPVELTGEDAARAYGKLVGGINNEYSATQDEEDNWIITNMTTGEQVGGAMAEDDIVQYVASQILTEYTKEQYAQVDQKIIDAMEKLSSENKLDSTYGANFSGAIRNAVVQGDGKLDFTALYSQISPAEKEELLSLADSPTELAKAFGLTTEDLEALGLGSAKEFASAFQQGLANWNISDYITGANAEGEKQAEAYEIDVEEFKAYRNLLLDQNEAYENNVEGLNKVALANKRMEKGVKALADDWEDLNSILSDENASLEDISSVMPEINEALQDILNLDTKEFSLLPPNFARDNWNLIQDVVNGVEGAVDTLRNKAGEEILMTVDGVLDPDGSLNAEFADLHNAISSFDATQFEVGVAINKEDQQAFYDSCQSLIEAAGMTAEQAQAYFGSMGYDVKFTKKPQPVTETVWDYNYSYDYDQNGNPTNRTVHATPRVLTGYVEVPVIETITPNGSYGGGLGVNTTAFTGRRSGGGGGGSKQEKKDNSEIERYHEVKEVINDLSREYDNLAKAKDRAFGLDRLSLMEDELKATEEMIEAQKQYLEEIEQYRKADKEKLAEYGASFDEMGRITNYDEMYEVNIKAYNEAVDKVNAGSMTDEQFEEYEKEFDEFVDDIAQYEETLNLLEDEETNLLNLQNQLFDAKIASITYKVELDTRLADNEIAYLEYQFENLTDSIDDTALSLVNLGKQTEQNLKKVESYQTGIKEMLSLSGFSDQDIEIILNGTEDISIILQSKTLTDEQISTLEEYRDALMDVNAQMSEMRKQVHEELIAAFEEMNEEMSREVEAIDHFSDMLQSYRDIIDLVGKDNMGISNAMLQEMSRANVENASAALRSQKAILDANKSALAEAEASLAKAREANQEEDIKLWEETVRTLSETVTSGEEELMSRWQSALQAAADAFSDAVDQVMEDFEKAMTGVAGGFDALQEKYNQQKEINDRYLDDYQKIYELSKLNRDITKSIDDTDNIRAKTRLRDIQEEINALQESNTEMTQYEVNELRARYELRLAEIALEEAQNAKNQVRMSRDAEGNWSYVYTANQENVDNAMQNYEDKLYAYQTLTQERAEEIEEQILALPKEFSEAIQEIMMDLTLTEEEKEQKIFDTRKYYEDKYNYLLGQISISLNDAKRLYENDWQAFSQATGYKISDAEEWQDKFDETILAQLTGYTNIEEAQAKFNTATDNMFSDLLSAYKQYKIDTDNIMSEVAIDAEVFTEKITNGTQEAADSIKSLADAAAEGFGGLVDWVNWYANEYGAEIQKYISENDKMITSINSILEKLGKVPSALSQAEAAARQAVEEAQAKEAEIDTIVSSGGSGSGPGGYVSPDGTEPPVEEPEIKYWRVMYDADGKDKNQATPTVYKTGKYLNAIDALNAAREKYMTQRINSGISRQQAEQDWLKARAAGFYIPEQYIYKASAGGGGSGKPPTVTQFDSGSLLRLNTGGYTGEWGAEGRIAMLHQKELVLNADDTTNFLSAIKIIRDISRVIDLRATAQQSALNAMTSSTVAPMAQVLQQEVTIHAEFPNATQRTEIEAAFDTLLNRASQFANRKNQ